MISYGLKQFTENKSQTLDMLDINKNTAIHEYSERDILGMGVNNVVQVGHISWLAREMRQIWYYILKGHWTIFNNFRFG